MATKDSYLPYLDGLRAIAVLMLVSVHMKNAAWHSFYRYFSVTIFFVMSGYLITTLLLREERSGSRVSLAGFYIRRAFRILPLYYLVLALYCALILVHNGFPEKRELFQRALPYDLFYFQEVPMLSFHLDGGRELPFYQSWSLGIEEKFYLIWPIVCFVLLKRRRSMRLPCAILLIIACALLGKYLRPYSEILLGCALALALDEPGVRAFAQKYGRAGTYASLGLVVLGHIGICMNKLPGGPVTYALLLATFFGFLVCQATALRSVLSFGPLAGIGKLSYGIYLFHLLCLNAVSRWTGNSVTLTYIATCTASISISYALQRMIEKPLIRIGKNVAARVAQRQARNAGAVPASAD